MTRAAAATALLAWRLAGQEPPIQPRQDPAQTLRIPIRLAEGFPVARIYVHLVNPAGDAARDEALKTRIAQGFGMPPGSEFKQILGENGLRVVLKLPEVATAEYRLYQWDSPGEVQIAIIVRLKDAGAPRPPTKPGIAESGKLTDFPRVFSNERALLKVIFQPSLGFFLDQNVWVGNPEAFTNGGKPNTVAWPEAAHEIGLGGATQIGSRPAYFYGAVSYEWSTTLSQDTYQKTRIGHGELELGYAGILFAKPGRKTVLDLSAGRQSFALNSNFLFGHVLGSTNGSYRGASGLSPRNAFRMTAIARLNHGPLTLHGFFLEPNSLNAPGQRNRFAGVNVRYNDNKKVDASFLYATVFESEGNFTVPGGGTLPREGLRAVNPRLRWIAPLGAKGLWFEGEFAHQSHARFAMSALGYGAWAGYTFLETPWRPAFRYRYAFFSGDDPRTPVYERFDPLLGGVQGNWVQGLTMVKMFNNANLRSHRVEVSVKPRPNLELLVDYHRLFADDRNNLGGRGSTLQALRSKDVGHAIAPTMRLSLSQGLYVQALVDLAVPGAAFRLAMPRAVRTWPSYQIAMYFGL